MVKKKEEQEHPLFAVSGNHEHLRLRKINQIITKNSKQGWTIDYVDGSDVADLSTALSPNAFFDSGGKTLVVVTKPEKADIELLTNHYNNDDGNIVALLHYTGNPKGNTKFGKFLKAIRKAHLNYQMPKDWELDDPAFGAQWFKNLQAGAGFGLRLYLPIGPIKLDYGWPLHTDGWNDTGGRFHFNIGYAF